MTYLTEEEAKPKWCPMVRQGVLGTEAPGVNRLMDDKSPDGLWMGYCIGSECMMWREGNPSHVRGTVEVVDRASGTGYCGLAGRPE